MYHRYMQGEDGQFERHRVPDGPRPGPRTQEKQEPREPEKQAAARSTVPKMPSLPGLLAGKDRGDLLVLLILLLLLGEGNEESSAVIMTLGIFLLLQ